MIRKKLAVIAIILTFVMIVSMSVPTFALNMSETYSNQEESEVDLEMVAELEIGNDAAGLWQDTFEPVILVNPLYADVVNPENIEVVQYSEKPAGSSEELVGSSGGSSGEEIPTTEEEFAEAYRQAFEETLGEWGSQFTVQYKVLSDEEISNEQCNEYFNRLAEVALENQFIHTGNPTQGDYGRFQYAGQSYGGGLEAGYEYEIGKYYLIINFDTLLTYYTTPEQEAEETAMLSVVMDSLDLNTKTEYGKIKAIYDYICQHVTYDFANLNNDDYDLKYTSYAALVNGTAVCQGYSVLFYRMALEAGLDARIISGYGGDGGSGGGGPHAWNIVKLKGLYYNIDSTWDAGRDPYDYFLKSPDTFDLHARDAEYETWEFHASYPMAVTDYVVVPEDLIVVTDISDCTINLEQTSYIYDGSPKEPSVTVMDGSVILSYGTDYEVTYSENTNAGVASVTINGVGNYTGSVSEEFVISKAPAEIAFVNNNVIKTLNDEVFINELTGNTDGDITYESSDSNVATVDTVSGAVTIEGTGTAVITATSTESDNYEAGSAQYTLTVKYGEIEIITQPESCKEISGKRVHLVVEAVGDGLSYQWQYLKKGRTAWADSGLSSAHNSTLTFKMSAGYDGMQFRCVLTDENGQSVTSDEVTSTMIVAPEIVEQPGDVEAAVGETVQIRVAASGTGLAYQWQYQKAGVNTWKNSGLSSAANPTLKFKMSSGYDGMKFRCKVTNADGLYVYSAAAAITLVEGPNIVVQPGDVNASLGTAVRIQIVAEGTDLTYCWQYQRPSTTTWKTSGLSSASSDTLSFKMSSGYDGMKFRCKVTDAGGRVIYTNAALVRSVAGPAIVEQPEDVTKELGTKATFSIVAEGNSLTYQWQYQKIGKTTWVNSTSTGNKTNTLKVSTTTGTNGMKFRCIVTDGDGNITISNYATLTAM